MVKEEIARSEYGTLWINLHALSSPRRYQTSMSVSKTMSVPCRSHPVEPLVDTLHVSPAFPNSEPCSFELRLGSFVERREDGDGSAPVGDGYLASAANLGKQCRGFLA